MSATKTNPKATLEEYQVTLPIVGKLFITVEAESEEDAIRKAFEEKLETDMIEEWEPLKKIVEGNIFYGDINQPEAFKIDT